MEHGSKKIPDHLFPYRGAVAFALDYAQTVGGGKYFQIYTVVATSSAVAYLESLMPEDERYVSLELFWGQFKQFIGCQRWNWGAVPLVQRPKHAAPDNHQRKGQSPTKQGEQVRKKAKKAMIKAIWDHQGLQPKEPT